MARVLTKCPECGQKISNRFECRNCGLLFNRYFEAQARKKEAAKAKAARRSRNILILNTLLSALLLLGLLGGGMYFWNKKDSEAPVPAAVSVPAQTSVPVSQAAPDRAEPREAVSMSSSKPVDIAFNAVAVITSPWGQSTGFFIAEDTLLTTKKSVFYDEERLARETEQLRQDRIWLDEEPAKIQRLRERFEAETDPETKADLEEKLGKREQRLERRTLGHQELEKVVARLTEDMKTVTIDILTNDGRTFHMAYMDTSNTYGLALLTVFSTGIAPVKIADRPLDDGETVYTLGKGRTSIKGSFAGSTDTGLILSDVPINPGYFGGPLVDEKGMVFGVSIEPPREQRKKGLAVPIATVLQEFGR